MHKGRYCLKVKDIIWLKSMSDMCRIYIELCTLGLKAPNLVNVMLMSR